jgi:DNA-binding transcriptional MerR regulator
MRSARGLIYEFVPQAVAQIPWDRTITAGMLQRRRLFCHLMNRGRPTNMLNFLNWDSNVLISQRGALMPGKSELNLFDGFQLDMAVMFTDLSSSKIRTLRENGIVKPRKTRSGYLYGFTDLILLKLIKTLKDLGVKPANIKEANRFVKKLDPSKDLSKFKLFIQKDTLRILGLSDEGAAFCGLDQHGQLVNKQLVHTVDVGEALEKTRRRVKSVDKAALRSQDPNCKTYTLDQIKKRYGIA